MSMEANKVCGYLQRKAKGKLLSPWRKWYCVLNGRILFFYRNETDYTKLNSFSDVIDLGLVYSVDRAPAGLDFGILLSTHNGPLWLRTRDPLSCSMWLESLQAAIVLRTPKEVLTQPGFNFDLKPEQHNNAKEIKSSTGRASLASRLFRFSLDLIPGHNYSTLDGRKLRESSCDDITIPATEKLPRRGGHHRGGKQTQSMGGSVSNFLLMTSPDEAQNLLSVPSRAARQAKGASLSPRLPKSTIVAKLSTFAEQPSEPNTPCQDEISQPNFPKTVDTPLPANQEHPASKPLVDESSSCKPISEVVKEQKAMEKPTGKKDSLKKTPRRKSSLAMLKSFFFLGKQSKSPSAHEDREETSQVLKRTAQENSTANQKDSLPSETPLAVAAAANQRLEYTERDIEVGLEQSSDEEPGDLVQNTATVVAVIEGPVEESSANELMQEVFTWVQRMPPSSAGAEDAPNRKRSNPGCRPPLPAKHRQRFPSPPYDVPKAPRPISAPSALFRQTAEETRQSADPPVVELQSKSEKETEYQDSVEETESIAPCNDGEMPDPVEEVSGCDTVEDLEKPGESKLETRDENLQTERAEEAELTITQVETDVDQLVPCSPTGAEKVTRIHHLVRFFDSQSTQDAGGHLAAAALTPIAAHRLSFASTDIEIVEEETVLETVALLDN